MRSSKYHQKLRFIALSCVAVASIGIGLQCMVNMSTDRTASKMGASSRADEYVMTKGNLPFYVQKMALYTSTSSTMVGHKPPKMEQTARNQFLEAKASGQCSAMFKFCTSAAPSSSRSAGEGPMESIGCSAHISCGTPGGYLIPLYKSYDDAIVVSAPLSMDSIQLRGSDEIWLGKKPELIVIANKLLLGIATCVAVLASTACFSTLYITYLFNEEAPLGFLAGKKDLGCYNFVSGVAISSYLLFAWLSLRDLDMLRDSGPCSVLVGASIHPADNATTDDSLVGFVQEVYQAKVWTYSAEVERGERYEVHCVAFSNQHMGMTPLDSMAKIEEAGLYTSSDKEAAGGGGGVAWERNSGEHMLAHHGDTHTCIETDTGFINAEVFFSVFRFGNQATNGTVKVIIKSVGFGYERIISSVATTYFYMWFAGISCFCCMALSYSLSNVKKKKKGALQ